MFSLPKLHVFSAVAKCFTPFLEAFQSDWSMCPFLGRETQKLLLEILGKSVKKKIVDPCTMSSITKLKLTAENLKEVKDVNVNFSEKVSLKNSLVSDVKLAEFKYCQKMYKATAEKLIDRSPLK